MENFLPQISQWYLFLLALADLPDLVLPTGPVGISGLVEGEPAGGEGITLTPGGRLVERPSGLGPPGIPGIPGGWWSKPDGDGDPGVAPSEAPAGDGDPISPPGPVENGLILNPPGPPEPGGGDIKRGLIFRESPGIPGLPALPGPIRGRPGPRRSLRGRGPRSIHDPGA